MNNLSLILIAVGLGMDAFAVAIGAGVTIRGMTYRHVVRLSLHFGLFQFFMPIIGWAAGRTVEPYIAGFDHWLAFALLALIGGKMIRDFFSGDGATYNGDPTKGLMLLLLSVATSIDALAVGLSLAFLKVGIVYPSIVIGIVAFLMTAVGMRFGVLLGRVAGRWAELTGGLILIGIGLKIVVEHMVG